MQGKILDQKTDNQKLSILGAGLSLSFIMKWKNNEYGLSPLVYKTGRYLEQPDDP